MLIHRNLILNWTLFRTLILFLFMGFIWIQILFLIRSVFSLLMRFNGMVRRGSKIFGTNGNITTCFSTYVLSWLMYYAPAWCSSGEAHIRLLDGVVGRAERLCGESFCILTIENAFFCLNFFINSLSQRSKMLRKSLSVINKK